MEHFDNPLLRRATTSGDRDRTPALISSDRPMRSTQPSAAVKRLIGELGLRYRPSAQADLEAHAASLALLARDVADIPPAYLERAIAQHVVRSPYLPKASDLFAIAQSFLTSAKPKAGQADLPALAEKYNANLAAQGRRDMQWVVEGGDIRLQAR